MHRPEIGLQAADVPVHVIAAPERGYLTERRLIRAHMQAQRTHVLHTHGFRSDVVDGGLARLEGAAHITTLHGFTARNWRGHIYEWLQVRSARRAHAAVAVSAPIVERVRASTTRGAVHLVRNAVAPVPNPLTAVDARRMLGLPEEGLVLGWIGRMSFEKGPDLFLEALAIEARRRGGADGVLHVAMIGDGNMRQGLSESANALPSTVRVLFPGLVAEASRYLAAFDGLVLTSRTEGTPMVILEAMNAGVPIVATAVGGVPDVVDDTCAFLASPTPPSIAARIGDLLSDSDARARRALQASTRANEHFSYAAWLTAYETVYREALRRVRSRR